MGTRDPGACVAEVDSARLSAWRDVMLPPAEMERMREHVTRCAACQSTLAGYDEVARALGRQRDLEPGDRIVEAVRRRITHQPPRRWTPSRRTWGSVSALASVAAVILLFVYVLEIGPMGRLRPGSQATVVPTFTLAPTPAPTIGPSAFTPAVSLQDAWGPRASTAQISTQLDATHAFVAYSATPDGQKLLGTMRVTNSSGPASSTMQAGILDVTTRQFTPIGDRLSDDPASAPHPWPYCRHSDRRFVVCADHVAPGSLGPGENSPDPIKLWSYDLVSGQVRFITDSTKYPLTDLQLVSHGFLVLSVGSQIGVINLTTNTLSLLSLPARETIPIEFSWPYLVYFDQPDLAKPVKVRARDLATGEDIALTQVDALYAANADANPQPDLALTGDTLFFSLVTGRMPSSNTPPNNVSGPDAATTLYELDHLFASGAQIRPVARYHGVTGGVAGFLVGANDRLVVYNQTVAWDRAEDRFVRFSSLPDGQGPLASLSGNALILASFTPGEQVTIYDTARLRTTGS
jgi:hypothetical protein